MAKMRYPSNFNLSKVPGRTTKGRKSGVTMVMDKGLTLDQTKGFCEFAEFVDFVKLGFGTTFVTPNLEKKIQIYKQCNINIFFGGTLFEAFLIRDQLDDYIKLLKRYQLDFVEISDGVINLSQEEKVKHIKDFKNKGFRVLSEVGKKAKGFQMFPFVWVKHIQKELDAGSDFVITESRESGNVGIYRLSGKVRNPLINKIIHNLPVDKIIFEAPQKNQQHFFIKKVGCNVNLGNVAPTEIIALETMRIGLRGDTFFQYL